MQWLNENSRLFLSRGYLSEGENAEERIKNITDHAESILGIDGFSDKLYGYMSKGYVSLSSPVWSNFGKDRGLPISCFGSYIPDNMGGILHSHGEVGMMTKFGGGTSGFFGDLRERGSKVKDNGESSGAVHFMQLFETAIDVVSQGNVRRGSFAPYLPVEHPDIMEFLDIGTEGNPLQMLNHGVTVTNKWLEEMKAGHEDKRKVWAKVIQRRSELGYPYIMFKDNADSGRPDIYKELDMDIKASNLCSEIMLPSTDEYSFVCCLSSLNLLYFDEWKDTDLVETMTFFLDAVMEEFITKLEQYRDSEDQEGRAAFRFMERAYNFAKDHRALGLGVLGWHSLLQSKHIAFEDDEAYKLNVDIFKHIKQETESATHKLGGMLGEPKILKGTGRRNTTTMAIAPTKSSAFILGQVSQSIEPILSNSYVKDLAKTKVTVENEYLRGCLEKTGNNTKDVWDSIRAHDGSVQHLDCLNEQEKKVFRTFAEIDQMTVLQQAAVRQMFIDQGQSLNIMVTPNTPVKEINKLYLWAAENGIKALYYQMSMSAAQEIARGKLSQGGSTCGSSCEG